MKIYFNYILILILLINCKSDKCSFDNSFAISQESVALPSLMITSNFCNELLLKGDFAYYLKGYKISKKLYLRDSVYSYQVSNNDTILFDYSSNRKNGHLKISNLRELNVKFFMDINFKSKNYRLFKIDDIDSFYTLKLSKVYITQYNYGIVGEFILAKENNEWIITNLKGYIPNEKKIFSIFKQRNLE
ncbi:hypothetical protein [Chryseobacterium turcicum]|uniref:Uncharacterized protein n=1 Tax=Chryseobacterium turcicum TaxID=2898076 RepID=A0A9Q3YW09_9FLAO|nr:hypothetical protein [Chryseobacterium turcicum]MCD1117463.1 hypothetical protein [Chryseobacterium turcicum]